MTPISIVLLYLFSAFLSLVSALAGNWSVFLLSFIGFSCLSWVVFSGSMNLVQNVGSVYWIVRNNARRADPIIGSAFMRQVDPPWLIGKGVQIRFGRYSFQIGVCYPSSVASEDEGVLNAMQGRYMDEGPREIGSWR